MKPVYSALCFCASLCLTAQPAIQLDRVHHDFGKIRTSETVKTTFVVTNVGSEPLHLQRIDASCDCTTGAIPKPFLKPGESLELEFRFDPKNQKGFIHKYAYIITNDPKKPSVDLSLEAEVVPEIICTPEALYFTQALRTRDLKRLIKIKAGDGKPLKLISAKVDNGSFLSVTPKVKEGEIELEATFEGSKLPTDRRHGQGIIHITTDHPKQPDLKLLFYWSLAPSLQVEPEQLDFIPAELPESPKTETPYETQDVHLRQLQNQKFRILKVIEAPDFVSIDGIKSAQTKAKSVHKLRIKVIPEKLQTSKTGLIVLSTDDPTQNRIQIRIFALKDE